LSQKLITDSRYSDVLVFWQTKIRPPFFDSHGQGPFASSALVTGHAAARGRKGGGRNGLGGGGGSAVFSSA